MIIKKLFLSAFLISFSAFCFSQEILDASELPEISIETPDFTSPAFPSSIKKPKKPKYVLTEEDQNKFRLLYDYGVSFGQITRIEKMSGRSNFVRENFLIGLYLDVQTVNIPKFDNLNFMFQVSAYYPFYNTFNGMKQFPKQVILYAFDGFLAPVYQIDFIHWVKFDVALGIHYMYQLTDEYHMNYLGIGAQATVECPLSRRFTLFTSYFFALDNPNLGTNQKIQPFDISYQYHVNLGVRYCKKHQNTTFYFCKKDK